MIGVSKHKAVYRIFKSERINAIRKQYDAFLEEDKKRKERNEYILGRLDRMRQPTALVLFRQKPNPLRNWTSAVSGQRYPEDFASTSDLHIPVNRHQSLQDTPSESIDNYLVQEITKNYILIPKLRSTFNNPHIEQVLAVEDPITYVPKVQQNTFDTNNAKSFNDNNWQSKYEILNILKNEEKDIKTMQFATNEQNQSVSSLKNERNINICADANAGTEYKYLEELPEKDMSAEKVKDSEASHDYETVPGHSVIDNITNPDKFPAHTIEVDNIGHQLQNINLEYSKSEVCDHDPTDNTNYAGHDGYDCEESNVPNQHGEYTLHADHFEPVYNENEIYENQNIEIYEKDQIEISNKLMIDSSIPPNQFKPEGFVATNDRDENIQEAVHDSHLINESNHTNAPVYELTDNVDYMNENINVQRTVPNLEHQMNDVDETTGSERHSVEQVGTVALDNDDLPIENFSDLKDTLVENEKPFDDTELHAFNTEQREMFFVEQPEETRMHEQGDVNMDEQGYPLNEGESLNQEYSYYGNIEPGAYPVDRAEDAETLRYDTAYQQQYVNSYENAYENQPQQNDVENNYDPMQSEEIQPLYDQQNNSEELQPLYDQQDDYTSEQIESALNTEKGYSEQTQEESEYLVKPQLTSDIDAKLV